MAGWAAVGDKSRRTGRRRIFKPLVPLTTQLLTERAARRDGAGTPRPGVSSGVVVPHLSARWPHTICSYDSTPHRILKALDQSYKNHMGLAIIRAIGEKK